MIWLTPDDMMARYKISYTTLWRRCRDGDLPKPEKIGKLNRWNPRVVEENENLTMHRPDASSRPPDDTSDYRTERGPASCRSAHHRRHRTAQATARPKPRGPPQEQPPAVESPHLAPASKIGAPDAHGDDPHTRHTSPGRSICDS
jgi:predicted DNA-binding transcriptional regulator AlpA